MYDIGEEMTLVTKIGEILLACSHPDIAYLDAIHF